MTKANPFFVSLSGEDNYEWRNEEFAKDPSEVYHAGAGGHDSAKVPVQKKGGAKKARRSPHDPHQWGDKDFGKDPSEVDYAGAGGGDDSDSDGEIDVHGPDYNKWEETWAKMTDKPYKPFSYLVQT